MYRRGIVEQIDAAAHRVRVRFPDRQDLLSPWLEVLVRSSAGARVAGLPGVGSQVAVLLDETEAAGCVLGAVYSSADPPPTGASETVFVVELPEGGELRLCGSTSAVALATKVLEQLQAIRDELGSHTHLAGTLVSPSGAVTGVTGAATGIAWSPDDVGSEQVRSA